jgi:hypothetical protein
MTRLRVTIGHYWSLLVTIRNFAKAPQNDAEACSAKNKLPFSVKLHTGKVMPLVSCLQFISRMSGKLFPDPVRCS